MSISFKFLLNKRRSSITNEYPIILRVYVNREYKEHSLNIKIPEGDWDEKRQLVNPTHPSSKIYNAKILSDRSRLEKLILLSDIESSNVTADTIFKTIYHIETQTIAKNANHNFIDFGIRQVELLKAAGSIGNAMVYECAINKLKDFTGSKLLFKDLTYQVLTAFTNAMLKDGIKVNTISVYMRTIRAIYNRGRKEGIAASEVYPFSAYRIKNEKTISRTLTIEEMKSIVSLKLEENAPIWHWRNYFLLSFYLIGINFADLLALTGDNIKDGRIIFRRKKTSKIYSIKLQDAATQILSHYNSFSPNQNITLLPVLDLKSDALKVKNAIKQATKTCNEYLERIAILCSIDKNITTYYARYTWANIARSLGYSKDMIAEALGHDYGNKVTSIYLDNYDSEIIDSMNTGVINAVVYDKKDTVEPNLSL